MAKRALCVGINDYPFDERDLTGAVNDANGWSALLVEHFGFSSSDVTVLLDKKATKANIMNGLEDMVRKAQPGDVLVFTNSSHGTIELDEGGDEDEWDEALCPYDSFQNVIVDDELHELFDQLKDGVNLTVVLDSCSSGTGLLNPDEREIRYLDPSVLGRRVPDGPRRVKTKNVEAEMKPILLSACKDIQVAWTDGFEGVRHGVLTYYTLKAIREADYRITYRQLHARVLELLAANKYPQQPQLEGIDANKDKLVFS